MVRITKCPICAKINKIKHNHYNNFVCCSTKFPIGEYQINKIPQNTVKEPEITEQDTKEEEVETTTLRIEERAEEPHQYDFRCPDCNTYFDEEGNRNLLGGIKCPHCGLVDYDL